MSHLRELKHDPRNARSHNPRNIGMIAHSLQTYGPARSIAIDEDNVILAGNGVVEAATQIGVEHVRIYDRETGHLEPEPPDGAPYIFAVRISGLTPTQKAEYAIADNRTTDLSEFDADVLAALADDGVDLSQFWFEDELSALLAAEDEGTEGLTDPDDVPDVPDEPITKPGDLWLLGRHRLLCGDSTNVTDVDRLMDGAKADMVFTDPPYGMDLDTDYTKMAEKKIKSKTYDRVLGDDGDFDASTVLAFFPDCPEVFMWGADWYYTTLPPHGSWIVWDKRNEASDGLTGNHFEMLWSKQRHRRRIIRHLWAGFTARNDDTARVHPTEKPVAVLADVIRDYSADGAIIVDLFGGSGSTLIACEQTNRTAYLMELDPHYCDVIVKRYEQFTGETATRAEHAEAAD